MKKNKLTFNNTPNPFLDVILNEKQDKIWYSRSLAFLVYFIIVTDNDIFILINKRGEMLDNPGKWSMPCGYIDWDETLQDAVRREVYEENGIDIYDEYVDIFSNLYGPHIIDTNPENSRQNFLVPIYHVVSSKTLPELTTEYSDGESLECKWITMKEVINTDSSDWAFNHKEKIELFINNLIQTNFKPII